MIRQTGPYVAIATFCEKVLQERDNVLSYIRVIDRFTFRQRDANPPTAMPPSRLQVNLVINLKSGDAVGRYGLAIVPEKPSGERLDPIGKFPMQFRGRSHGVTTNFAMDLTVDEEGLWWFDVILEDDQLLTRVPLEIVYAPEPTGSRE